ncbi:MAG: hypothetical protein R3C56_05270 [Pirellulaceae bacterium]
MRRSMECGLAAGGDGSSGSKWLPQEPSPAQSATVGWHTVAVRQMRGVDWLASHLRTAAARH